MSSVYSGSPWLSERCRTFNLKSLWIPGDDILHKYGLNIHSMRYKRLSKSIRFESEAALDYQYIKLIEVLGAGECETGLVGDWIHSLLQFIRLILGSTTNADLWQGSIGVSEIINILKKLWFRFEVCRLTFSTILFPCLHGKRYSVEGIITSLNRNDPRAFMSSKIALQQWLHTYSWTQMNIRLCHPTAVLNCITECSIEAKISRGTRLHDFWSDFYIDCIWDTVLSVFQWYFPWILVSRNTFTIQNYAFRNTAIS